MRKLFNFDNIGGKIKNLVKWSCWITIVLIWIAAPITFIVLITDNSAELCWIPLVGAIVGPVFVWIVSWSMYAFGVLVEDTHAMRNKECPIEIYTDLQKGLINCCAAYGMTEDETVGTLFLLETPLQQEAMLTWMEAHTGATANDIIEQARNIHNNEVTEIN